MKKNKIDKVKTKKLKKISILIILIILVLSSIGLLIYINNKKEYITNVKIKNTNFHEIKINWKYSNDKDNFVVILSKNKFNKNIIDKLNNNTLENDYKILDTKNNKEILINDVLSNTTYYVGIISYKNKDNKKIYLNISDIKSIKTKKLSINEINDIKTNDITDNSIKLEWENVLINEKNLDGTDILVTYTILEKIDNTSNEINNYKEINTVTDNFIVINNLIPFKEYTYKVHVNGLVDNKLISSLDRKITIMTKLPKVNNIKTSTDYNSIQLNWDKLNVNLLENDILTYDIYYKTKDENYELLKEDIDTNTYTDTNLQENQTRYYYILAKVKRNDTIYYSIKSDIVNDTTKKKIVPSTNKNNSNTNNSNTNNNSTSSNTNSGSSSNNNGELTTKEKDQLAREVAKQIASSITGSTDLEKVTKAAQIVSSYYQRGVHKESGVDYRTPYGVFIKGESSCAGTTRALGMVLEYMGYSWTHAHENEWTHQWVILIMDGQIGYADGQVGFAGYGEHPAANW